MPISFADFKKKPGTVDTEVVARAIAQIDHFCESNPGTENYEYSTRELAERDALWWGKQPKTEQALLDAYTVKSWNASMNYSKPGNSWDSFTYIIFKLDARS